MLVVGVPKPVIAGPKANSYLHIFKRNAGDNVPFEASSLRMTADSAVPHPSLTRHLVAVLSGEKLTLLDLDKRSKVVEQPMTAPLVFWTYTDRLVMHPTLAIATSVALFAWRPDIDPDPVHGYTEMSKPVKLGERGDIADLSEWGNRRVLDLQLAQQDGDSGGSRGGGGTKVNQIEALWTSLTSCPRKGVDGRVLLQADQERATLVVVRLAGSDAGVGYSCAVRALGCTLMPGESALFALLVPGAGAGDTDTAAIAFARVRLKGLVGLCGTAARPIEAVALLSLGSEVVVWTTYGGAGTDIVMPLAEVEPSLPTGPAVYMELLPGNSRAAVVTRSGSLQLLELSSGAAYGTRRDLELAGDIVLGVCSTSSDSLLLLSSKGPRVEEVSY
jgi:hypothetical protein